MTVKELTKQLMLFPQNAEVILLRRGEIVIDFQEVRYPIYLTKEELPVEWFTR